MLILPDHPLFELTLATAKRPGWRDVAAQDQFVAFVAMPGDSGLLTPMSWNQTQDFMEGGAYDERMNELGIADELEFFGDGDPIGDGVDALCSDER